MMKNFIIATLLLVGFTTVNAETPAPKKASSAQSVGKWSIGGTIGLTYSKVSDGDGGVSFKIMPDVNYRLSKKWSVGMQVGYSHGYAAFGSLDVSDIKSLAGTAISTIADIASDNTMTLNSVRVAPYARYDFYQIGKFGFFVEGSFGYVHVSSSSVNAPAGLPVGGGAIGAATGMIGEPSINAIELNIRPGVMLKLNDRFEILAKIGSFGYMFAKNSDSDMKLHRVGFDFSSYNMLLGMNYHF